MSFPNRLLRIGIPTLLVSGVVGWMMYGLHHKKAILGDLNQSIASLDVGRADATDHSLQLIESTQGERDPEIRANRARLQMEVGYDLAHAKDYQKARKVFLALSKEPARLTTPDPNYGSYQQQARYQAAVCLVAAGKKEEAEEEFYAILRERPAGPFVKAAYERLVRLNGGDPTDLMQTMLDDAISSRSEAIQRELASCGPKAIKRVQERLGLKNASIAEITSRCGTDIEGTTMERMLSTLTSLGAKPEAMEVNADDFQSSRTPFIWLIDSHYLVVEGLDSTVARVYDPTVGKVIDKQLPQDPENFRPVIIRFKN